MAPLPRIAQRARPVATQSCLLNRVCANRFVACETKQLPEDNNASALRCAGGLRRSASVALSVSGEAFALLHVLAECRLAKSQSSVGAVETKRGRHVGVGEERPPFGIGHGFAGETA